MHFDRIYRSTRTTRNGRPDKNVAIRTHTFEHEGIVIEQEGTGANYTKLNHAQVTRLHADLGQWLAAHPADETVTPPLWTDR